MLLDSLLQYILNNNYKIHIKTDNEMLEYAFKHILKNNVSIVNNIDSDVIVIYLYKTKDYEIDNTHKFIYYMYNDDVVDSYFGCPMEDKDLTCIQTNLI